MSKIADLPNAPEWLRNATVTNENVEITSGGCVIWHDGTWYDGEWCDGEWRNGTWRGGWWYDGEWLNGEWLDGIWRDGTWHDGTWHGGTWHDGTWLNGTWRGGWWYDGEWLNGEWLDGIWHGGTWHDGTWCGGEWRDGEWHGGAWHGGTWHDGMWQGGTWSQGIWRGGIWQGGIWLDSQFLDRIAYMAAVAGLSCDGHGNYVGYRSVENDYSGRWDRTFKQELGDHRQEFEYDPKPGVCRKGIHVGSINTAYNYFSQDPTSRLIMVKFHRNDLIDCDGEKARIKAGVFTEIPWPWKG